ncbi:hypothetical protein [uncultured Amphritea sp.]|mgnify:CR=1 FL=1|uniref:hypothetical protein n=1 Tax=Amphritea sp. TaxID=1872502 RepID=UPI00262BD8F3|nr:hypothetical protein [uncultured Amphritea sp.]
MSIISKESERASPDDMNELRSALKHAGIDIRSFCEYLAERLAEVGHEEESIGEKYRGWFKSGRFPEKQLLKQMWELLSEHDDFIKSQQVKPNYVRGIIDSELEHALTELSKNITTQLK